MVVKLSKLFIIILFSMVFKSNSSAVCETVIIAQEQITIIKEILYPYLYEYVRTDDFKILYEKTWVYRYIFLNEAFIKTFLNNVDWIKFAEDTKNLTLDNKLDEIYNMFCSYADNKYHSWFNNYYKINAKACENAFIFINNHIKQTVVFIDHNKQNFIWLIPLGICYKSLIFENIQDNIKLFDVNGFLTSTEIITQVFPHILFLMESNALIPLIQNIDSYIITNGAWQQLFQSEEWKQVVFSQNRTIFILGISLMYIISNLRPGQQ